MEVEVLPVKYYIPCSRFATWSTRARSLIQAACFNLHVNPHTYAEWIDGEDLSAGFFSVGTGRPYHCLWYP